LPEVPGGMRHDDDALQGLLKAAKARLKRGYIKPFNDCNPVVDADASSLLESPSMGMSQQPSQILSQQGMYPAAQAISGDQDASQYNRGQPQQDASQSHGAVDQWDSFWDEWEKRDQREQWDAFPQPQANMDGNLDVYGDSRDGRSQPTTSGTVHTIQHTNAYTSTGQNTGMSHTGMSGHALVQNMWNHEDQTLNFDANFFKELTAGMGLPDSAGRADSIYSSQEGYSSDEALPQETYSSDEPPSQGRSEPLQSPPFQSQRQTGESIQNKPSREEDAQTRRCSQMPPVNRGGVSMAAAEAVETAVIAAVANGEPIQGALLRKAHAASSDTSSSNALGNRRRREGESTTAEAAREDRRKRWMSAYDGAGRSQGSSLGHSGYTAANSSAYASHGRQ